uniref:Uncharacterized protein n=1 Tax=Podoviridae sp. ct8Lf7 TaxID=2827723 RepID=A0A8S5S0M3_9CAUD|nr:MAG TPA: hypothetical protein [Podoviridae sp. ct8Lf7]
MSTFLTIKIIFLARSIFLLLSSFLWIKSRIFGSSI